MTKVSFKHDDTTSTRYLILQGLRDFYDFGSYAMIQFEEIEKKTKQLTDFNTTIIQNDKHEDLIFINIVNVHKTLGYVYTTQIQCYRVKRDGFMVPRMVIVCDGEGDF